MFERYTEKARRVIFFARYDASQYGSAYIDTEHLLLGLLREDYATTKFLVPDLRPAEQIRRQIESRITVRERISTSVEVPLTPASRRALNLAAEEAEKCGQKHIGPEHLLLALYRLGQGLASEILHEYKLDLANLEERVRKLPARFAHRNSVPSHWSASPVLAIQFEGPQKFLEQLHAGNWQEVRDSLCEQAIFVDAEGKSWSGSAEISAHLESLLAPFATKNARYHVETSGEIHRSFWVGTVLWEHVHLKANLPPGNVRMTLGMFPENGRWSIFLIQIAAEEPGAVGMKAAR
jgi:hypothetical protein